MLIALIFYFLLCNGAGTFGSLSHGILTILTVVMYCLFGLGFSYTCSLIWDCLGLRRILVILGRLIYSFYIGFSIGLVCFIELCFTLLNRLGLTLFELFVFSLISFSDSAPASGGGAAADSSADELKGGGDTTERSEADLKADDQSETLKAATTESKTSESLGSGKQSTEQSNKSAAGEQPTKNTTGIGATGGGDNKSDKNDKNDKSDNDKMKIDIETSKIPTTLDLPGIKLFSPGTGHLDSANLAFNLSTLKLWLSKHSLISNSIFFLYTEVAHYAPTLKRFLERKLPTIKSGSLLGCEKYTIESIRRFASFYRSLRINNEGFFSSLNFMTNDLTLMEFLRTSSYRHIIAYINPAVGSCGMYGLLPGLFNDGVNSIIGRSGRVDISKEYFNVYNSNNPTSTSNRTVLSAVNSNDIDGYSTLDLESKLSFDNLIPCSHELLHALLNCLIIEVSQCHIIPCYRTTKNEEIVISKNQVHALGTIKAMSDFQINLSISTFEELIAVLILCYTSQYLAAKKANFIIDGALARLFARSLLKYEIEGRDCSFKLTMSTKWTTNKNDIDALKRELKSYPYIRIAQCLKRNDICNVELIDGIVALFVTPFNSTLPGLAYYTDSLLGAGRNLLFSQRYRLIGEIHWYELKSNIFTGFLNLTTCRILLLTQIYWANMLPLLGIPQGYNSTLSTIIVNQPIEFYSINDAIDLEFLFGDCLRLLNYNILPFFGSKLIDEQNFPIIFSLISITPEYSSTNSSFKPSMKSNMKSSPITSSLDLPGNANLGYRFTATVSPRKEDSQGQTFKFPSILTKKEESTNVSIPIVSNNVTNDCDEKALVLYDSMKSKLMSNVTSNEFGGLVINVRNVDDLSNHEIIDGTKPINFHIGYIDQIRGFMNSEFNVVKIGNNGKFTECLLNRGIANRLNLVPLYNGLESREGVVNNMNDCMFKIHFSEFSHQGNQFMVSNFDSKGKGIYSGVALNLLNFTNIHSERDIDLWDRTKSMNLGNILAYMNILPGSKMLLGLRGMKAHQYITINGKHYQLYKTDVMRRLLVQYMNHPLLMTKSVGNITTGSDAGTEKVGKIGGGSTGNSITVKWDFVRLLRYFKAFNDLNRFEGLGKNGFSYMYAVPLIEITRRERKALDGMGISKQPIEVAVLNTIENINSCEYTILISFQVSVRVLNAIIEPDSMGATVFNNFLDSILVKERLDNEKYNLAFLVVTNNAEWKDDIYNRFMDTLYSNGYEQDFRSLCANTDHMFADMNRQDILDRVGNVNEHRVDEFMKTKRITGTEVRLNGMEESTYGVEYLMQVPDMLEEIVDNAQAFIVKLSVRNNDNDQAQGCADNALFTWNDSHLNSEVYKYSKHDYVDAIGFNKYHEHDTGMNKEVLKHYGDGGYDLDYYEQHYDGNCKNRIFNTLFGTNCDSYQSMLDHLDESKTSINPMNAPQLQIISEETGRVMGFLHDSKHSKAKLIKQIESSVEQVGRSVYHDDPDFGNDLTPERINLKNEFIKSITSMPMNSTAGVGHGITSMQYIANKRFDELMEDIYNVDPSWKFGSRLDSGNSFRIIYVHHIIIRLQCYMHFKSMYTHMMDHPWSTMGNDLYEVSKKLFAPGRLGFDYSGGKSLSIDLANFDNTCSHAALYQVMNKTCPKSEVSDQLLNIHQYDYPFYDKSIGGERGGLIRPRSTRLMTGHYLTSVIGTGTQISRYRRGIKDGMQIEVKALTGDDSAIWAPADQADKIIEAGKDAGHLAGPLGTKSKLTDLDLAYYNRRIFIEGVFPFNNVFTLINSIYRQEKTVAERSEASFLNRFYNIGLAYVAFTVLMQYFENGSECVEILTQDLKRLIGCDPRILLRSTSEMSRKRVDFKVMPIFKDVAYDLEHNIEVACGKALEISPLTMMSRYSQFPHIDFASPTFYVIDGGTLRGINTDEMYMNKFVSTPLPQGFKDTVYHRFEENNDAATIFADCLSRLSLPVQPLGNFQFYNFNELIIALTDYLEKLYPNTYDLRK